jgi:hypothetical protein
LFFFSSSSHVLFILFCILKGIVSYIAPCLYIYIYIQQSLSLSASPRLFLNSSRAPTRYAAAIAAANTAAESFVSQSEKVSYVHPNM